MCVYHGHPDEMLGSTLYPLQDLKVLNPRRYALERLKYQDHEVRRRIPEQRVPKLECAR